MIGIHRTKSVRHTVEGDVASDAALESAPGENLADRPGREREHRIFSMKNIRQNLFLAFIYNIVGVPVAAGMLYPFLSVLISPIWASAAMTLSSVSVIGNAIRLRRVEL